MISSKTLAALLALPLAAGSALASYNIGDVVDSFVLEDVDGVSHSLYDYEGKLIVLNFGEHW